MPGVSIRTRQPASQAANISTYLYTARYSSLPDVQNPLHLGQRRLWSIMSLWKLPITNDAKTHILAPLTAVAPRYVPIQLPVDDAMFLLHSI